MLISDYLSQKIKLLSIFAMISVIFIHVNNLSLVNNPKPWFVFFSDWFFTGLQMWAVPFFFLVSGFFFDRGFEKRALNSVELKLFLIKKIKMLFVPYLLWATIGGILILPLFIFHNYINGVAVFERTIFSSSTIWSFLNNLFGILGGAPSGNGPLWYVRLLILLFLFAPLWILLRRFSKYLLLFISISFILLFSPVNEATYSEIFFNRLFIKVAGVGWFLLGMSFSALRIEDKTLSKTFAWGNLGGGF